MLAGFFIVVATIVPVSVNEGTSSTKVAMVYELYSWESKGGGWSFSLLVNTSMEKSPQQVFDPKAELLGVSRLKKRMAQLPKGATIYWLTSLKSLRGHQKLSLPPAGIRTQVRQAAEQLKLTLEES